jgi:sulfopyruvate decarboxylase TPP-binding subunit
MVTHGAGRAAAVRTGEVGAIRPDGTIGDAEATPPNSAVPVALDPVLILQHIRQAQVSHVVTVPDTHQRTLLELLAKSEDPRLLTVCTEDEAIAVGAGLYIGGVRPLLLIQNAGLFASMNTLRGISLDGRVPTCLLIGEFQRDPNVPSRENTARVVHLLEPTLEAWGVPYYRLDQPGDLRQIPVAYERSLEERGPVALLVGASTAELT